MNITQEQYETDIRNAQVSAWEEGVEIAIAHTLLTRAGATVEDLRNPYLIGATL